MEAHADLPVYSRGELARRNGQENERIWVSYKGIIYDVTDSRLWLHGFHYGNLAGQDLTGEMLDAPHTDRVFASFPAVGKLSPTETT